MAVVNVIKPAMCRYCFAKGSVLSIHPFVFGKNSDHNSTPRRHLRIGVWENKLWHLTLDMLVSGVLNSDMSPLAQTDNIQFSNRK